MAMRLMKKYLSPYYKIMLVGLSIKIFGSLIELAIPYILSYILDEVVVRENIYEILLWGGAMLICAALALISNITANRMASKVAMKAAEGIRHDLFEKTMYLSSRQTDRFTIPSLESRLTTDTYHIHSFLGMIQRLGVRAPILLIGGVTLTLILDFNLSLVMIAVLPFIGGTVLFISKKGIPMYEKVQKSVDKMVRVVREDAQGIRIIKALSKTEYEQNRFDIANKELVKNDVSVGRIMSITSPLINLFMNIGLVGVILAGAFLVRSGDTKPGIIIAFIQYFTLISMSMMSITRIFVMYTRGSASANRIQLVLDSESEIFLQDEEIFPKKDENEHIVFDNVNFSYNGKKENLKNINFKIRHGDSLGIIGATGSGKTTIIQLLMRFYDVDSGSIRVNGRDVRTIKLDELHEKFGIVQQNDAVFSDTVGENIALGRDIPPEQMRRVAKISQALDYIENFEDEFEHQITSKGTNISGGQKQRLLIARALADNPEILVLDDSSSALDYKTDAALRQAIRACLPDTTTIIIAQRVSSIMNCDTIIVLEEGEVYGIGTHDELLKTCNIYREISDSQMGGAIVE